MALPPGAHLDAVQQPAHAPVRVGLHVAQRVRRHAGDVSGVHVLLICAAGQGKDREPSAHGVNEDVRSARRTRLPTPARSPRSS